MAVPHTSDTGVDRDTRSVVEDLTRELIAAHPPQATSQAEFLGARFDAGLAWIHFPEGLGGLGLAPGLQGTVDAMVDEAGGPSAFRLNPMGYGMAGPTLIAHGSEALKERLLRPLYTCEEIWCQLFSEPGAGSDLAGLATSAVATDGGWIVNGQKVWTSLAHRARWALLLARTDPDAPKHRGMTYFVLDMDAAEVEARPLRQLTGDAEFNEVSIDGARIEDSHRLGDVGDGWHVAMTTLMNERNAIGGGSIERGSGAIADATALWHERPDLRTPQMRERLIDLIARADGLRLTGMRYAAARSEVAGPEGSIGKLAAAELNQHIYEYCVEFLGMEGTLFPGYEGGNLATQATPQWKLLRTRANTVEGGTSEVLRNIVGERILQLPGDIRVDNKKAWKDVPRG